MKSKILTPYTFDLKPSGGFTMIELLVAIGLFMIVVGIVSGTFVRSLRTQRSIVALMAANDNASLTIEKISREIRTGFNFSTNAAKTELNFIEERAGAVKYSFNEDEGTIERNGIPVTSGNVKVNYLIFNLMGAAPDDGQATRVTIQLGVGALERSVENVITRLQTTVSSRQLDG